MFGIGFTELMLILIVAVIFIGPEKLPELAKTLGKTLREFKRATNDIKRSIDLSSFDDPPKKGAGTSAPETIPEAKTIDQTDASATRPAKETKTVKAKKTQPIPKSPTKKRPTIKKKVKKAEATDNKETS